MDIDQRILEELRLQTRWLRLQGLQTLLPLLKQQLASESERQAFELSDGLRTTRDIGKAVGKGHATIARWWARWGAIGIASIDQSGRASHLMSLSDLGIEVGQVTEQKHGEASLSEEPKE